MGPTARSATRMGAQDVALYVPLQEVASGSGVPRMASGTYFDARPSERFDILAHQSELPFLIACGPGVLYASVAQMMATAMGRCAAYPGVRVSSWEVHMEDITNFVQLTELVATSGQPTRDHLRHISTLGYLAVVNLALADSDRAIPDEGNVVAGLGMSYIHIPVRFDRPTVDDLRLFIGTMRALEGRKVWVHCVLNFRVSAFMYHYLRQEKGYPDTESRSPVLDRWQPRMDPVWAGFLELTREEIGAWSDGGLTQADK